MTRNLLERDWHGRIVMENLTGLRFGFWTVLAFDKNYPTVTGNSNYKWVCRCDCGIKKSVSSTSLKNGKSKSCGCGIGHVTSSTHGLTRTYIHRKWEGMKARCLNKNNKDYERYGGRGIRICEGILSSPQIILNIIGHRPNRNLSIDRKDNNGNYSCGACQECMRRGWSMNLRWATRVEQQRNKRNNKIVVIDGDRMSISEAAERFQLTYATVWQRSRKGKTGFELVL